MSNKIFEIKTKFHASTLPPALVGLFVSGAYSYDNSTFVSAVVLRDKRPDWRVRDYNKEMGGGRKQIIATTGAIFDRVFEQLRAEYIGGTGYTQLYSLADCMWYMLDKKLKGVSHQPHKGDATGKDKKTNHRTFKHPDGILSARYRSLYPSNEEIANTIQHHKDDEYWAYDCESLSYTIEGKFRGEHFVPPTEKEKKKKRSYARQGFDHRIPVLEECCSSYEFLCLREAYNA